MTALLPLSTLDFAALVRPLCGLLALAGAGPAATAQEGQDPPSADAPFEVREPLPISVEDAVQLALANNLDYQISEVQTEIAHFDLLGSWGSFDWVFDASASIRDSQFETGPNPQNPALPGGFVIDSDPEPTFAIDLTKPLTTGGSFIFHFDSVLGADAETTSVDNAALANTTPGVTTDTLSLTYTQPLRRGAWREYATSTQRESEVLYRQQQETQRGARQALVLSVHNAYWELVSAFEQLGVAESSLELGVEQLEQNQRRLDAGVGTEVDVLQARAEVATRTESKLSMENLVSAAMDNLKSIIFGSADEGLWDTPLEATTPLPGDVSVDGMPTWSEAMLVAIDRRSDLRQQRYEIDAARLRHGRTLSERLSALDLDVSATSRNVDLSDGRVLGDTLAFEFPIYSATLRYNMPIGNKTRDNAERAARARVRSAMLTYDQVETQAVAAVRSAVREVAFRAQAVRAAEQSLELAQRQLEAEEARYDADLSTTFQVLEFQQQLIEALSNERRARVEFAKALVALESAIGRLGDEDGQ